MSVGSRDFTPSLVSLFSSWGMGTGLVGAFRCMAAKAVSAILTDVVVVMASKDLVRDG